MQLGLSESLSALVARRFTAAKEGGHLIFSPTYLSNIQVSGIPFQLRCCPALAKKPTATPKLDDDRPTKKPDPFENPPEELLIAQIPTQNPTHRLVLNKFPVIPDHFILATKEWKPQTDLLESEDLEATYACVKTWADRSGEDGGRKKRLFAFFNSGLESGASQPHRHIQFLPVEAMMYQEADDGGDGSWRPLIDVIADQSNSKPHTTTASGSEYRWSDRLPFAHFALPLSSNPSADSLYAIYLSLYRAAVAAVAVAEGSRDDTPPRTEGEAAISYNLAMTESAMMICPRRNESAKIPMDGANTDVSEAGVISLNGTTLAGTLMVKAEAEWNELRRNPEVFSSVLATVGYPPEALKGVSSL